MKIDSNLENALIEATRQIAREEIMPRFRNLSDDQIEAKSRVDDLVTIADKRTEQRLSEVVTSLLPHAVIVGEEGVASDPSVRDALDDADLAVIIDPVDGTFNFANGLPLFGVILAIVENGEATSGLIYDPVLDDWVIGRRGGGAWFQSPDGRRRPLSFNNVPNTVADASGLIHSYLFYGDERRRLFQAMPDFVRTGGLRCSAHEYRSLAQSAADFILSPMLTPWDHVAGCLIAEEAGGVAKLLDGTPYRAGCREGRLLVARSELLWETAAAHFDDFGIKSASSP